MPDDIAEADALEDGHDRVIDPVEAGATIYDDHGLSPRDINPDAAKVVRRLRRFGFQAYLVGGCVRDLLAGQRPKDFDIATSATPRQIKKLFRNSRVIGRRFRLVHIHFGNHILEVSTFRRDVPREDGDELLIRRDNVFGRADEDAHRRDFTCNALFFDIERNEVIDFVGGMKDIRRGCIEVIGDPVTRLREDPVRMLRAIKFAGRLDFDIADEVWDAIVECREELRKSAAPRLFEEVQRLLNRGAAYSSFKLLYETELLDVLLPEIANYLDAHEEDVGEDELSGAQRLWNCLKSLDRMVEEGRDVTSVTMLASLFCHLFYDLLNQEGPPPPDVAPVLYDVGVQTEELLKPIALRLQMPRRDVYRIKQLVVALRRFLARKSSRKKPSPNQLVRKEYFPESLQLFEIYSQATGRHQGEVHRWMQRFEDVTGRRL